MPDKIPHAWKRIGHQHHQMEYKTAVLQVWKNKGERRWYWKVGLTDINGRKRNAEGWHHGVGDSKITAVDTLRRWVYHGIVRL